MAMKVHIITYGCTFNQADTDAMKAALAARGDFECSNTEGDAEVVVMNTCSVKDGTQNKILHKAKELEAAGRKLVMTGCLAQATPEIVSKEVPGASILGTQASSEIAEVISAAAAGLRIVQTKKKRPLPFNVTGDGGIARGQISRGCLSNCSYCSTKLARGRLESFAPETIAEGVAAAVQEGAKEIQLTSQDTGCYGFDLGPRTDLAALVGKLCEIPGRFRIRIGMGSPEHFIAIKEKLATAMQNEKVYKFLHLPVQSGSDRVLSEMKRNYTAGQYAELVDHFRSALPDITIE